MGFVEQFGNIYTDTATNAITTGGTSGLLGGLGAFIGGPLSGAYQQQAYQPFALNYAPEPQKQAPKHKRFIEELRAEIQDWHGELRAA